MIKKLLLGLPIIAFAFVLLTLFQAFFNGNALARYHSATIGQEEQPDVHPYFLPYSS